MLRKRVQASECVFPNAQRQEALAGEAEAFSDAAPMLRSHAGRKTTWDALYPLELVVLGPSPATEKDSQATRSVRMSWHNRGLSHDCARGAPVQLRRVLLLACNLVPRATSALPRTAPTTAALLLLERHASLTSTARLSYSRHSRQY